MHNINIRNMIISRDKTSEFLDKLRENKILKDCSILRVIPSGNYHIFTFQITFPEEKEEIKRIEDDWI